MGTQKSTWHVQIVFFFTFDYNLLFHCQALFRLVKSGQGTPAGVTRLSAEHAKNSDHEILLKDLQHTGERGMTVF